MERWTKADFEKYQSGYGLLLDVAWGSPVLLGSLSVVCRPSQLEGFGALFLKSCGENESRLRQCLATLLEFEFINTRAAQEPYVFLRERSRLAARATGDCVVGAMRALVQETLGDVVRQQFPNKIRDSQDAEKMIRLAETIFQRIESDQFVKAIPRVVRFLLAEVFHGAEAYGYGNLKYMLAGNLLVLRCLCPMISVPEFYGLSDKAPSQMARKSLVLQGKILSQIANCSADVARKEELDEQLQPYAAFIAGKRDAYRSLVDALIADAEEGQECPVRHIGLGYDEPASEPQTTKSETGNADTPLKILQAQFPNQSRTAGLSFRAIQSLHRQLFLLKSQFYDFFQALCSKELEFTTAFAQETHEQKFSRLLRAAVDCASIQSTEQLRTLNYLLSALGQPPPQTVELSLRPLTAGGERPHVYSASILAKKAKQLTLQTLSGSFLVIAGEMQSMEAAALNGATKLEKTPLLLGEFDSEMITEIALQEAQTNTLYLTLQGAAAISGEPENGAQDRQCAFQFENSILRDQFLGELFEMCYRQESMPAFQAVVAAEAFHNGMPITVLLGKDSLALVAELEGHKHLIADLHFARLDAEFKAESVDFAFRGPTGKKIEGEFELRMPQQRLCYFQKLYGKAVDGYNGNGFGEEEEPDVEKL